MLNIKVVTWSLAIWTTFTFVFCVVYGRLLLATASLSVLGYDHDLTEPVIHAWNGRGTAIATA